VGRGGGKLFLREIKRKFQKSAVEHAILQCFGHEGLIETKLFISIHEKKKRPNFLHI
jgi:hypothetical protein